jgi:tetratricopeptide (TPR) repeat protein
MMCQAGADAARTGDYEQAVSMISTCLTMPGLPKDERANALEARAWSYSNLKQHALAIGDEEAAHKLRPPSEYRQFINYATYLRRVGRIQDSLNAVLAAERLEAGKVSMMTQYNKGWSLLELGRHAEAWRHSPKASLFSRTMHLSIGAAALPTKVSGTRRKPGLISRNPPDC